MTRLECAESLAASIKRLINFLKLNAPELIIENERQLLSRKLIMFPVNEDAQIACERIRMDVDIKEKEWLEKTGFYTDVGKQIKEENHE